MLSLLRVAQENLEAQRKQALPPTPGPQPDPFLFFHVSPLPQEAFCTHMWAPRLPSKPVHSSCKQLLLRKTSPENRPVQALDAVSGLLGQGVLGSGVWSRQEEGMSFWHTKPLRPLLSPCLWGGRGWRGARLGPLSRGSV